MHCCSLRLSALLDDAFTDEKAGGDQGKSILAENGCIDAVIELLLESSRELHHESRRTEAEAAAQVALHNLSHHFSQHGSLQALASPTRLNVLLDLTSDTARKVCVCVCGPVSAKKELDITSDCVMNTSCIGCLLFFCCLIVHLSLQIVQSASWLLCMLSAESDIGRTILMHAGVLEALVAHGQQSSLAAQEEAAWTFAAISADASLAEILVASSNCSALLVDLLSSSSEEVILQATWALANLSLQTSAAVALLELRPIRPLLKVVENVQDNPALLHQATRCLGTLFLSFEGRKQLLEDSSEASKALSMLARLAINRAVNVSAAALRAIVHACAQPLSAADLFLSLPTSDGVSRLAEVLREDHERDGRRTKTVCSAIFQLVTAITSYNPESNSDLPYTTGSPDAKPLEACVEPLLLVVKSERHVVATRAQAVTVLGQLAKCTMPLEEGRVRSLAASIVACGALPILETLSRSNTVEGEDLRASSASTLEVLSQCLTPTSQRLYGPRGAHQNEVQRVVRAFRSSPLAGNAPRRALCPSQPVDASTERCA